MARVLVVDDEPGVRESLRMLLSPECGVETAASVDEALVALRERPPDLVLLDLVMPGRSGLAFLEAQEALPDPPPVVVLTATRTVSSAVEAMKRGAADYVTKPFEIEALRIKVRRLLERRALEREVVALRARMEEREELGGLLGRSAPMRELFQTLRRVADSRATVLIRGESGTGKELVARAIHSLGPRSEGPFVAVNCAAIPDSLIESELFGHERGAFTGAVNARTGRFRDASGGTLFLDEIGDMSVELQAKLLRVLQSDEVTPVGGRTPEQVDVRIIAATHRDLDVAVQEGAFREDLLYRLRVVPVHIPPLRERPEDIRTLTEHFTERYAEELAAGRRFLTERTVEFLSRHDWPGNVRELENAVKRALVLSTSEVLSPDDFAFLEDSGARSDAAPDLESLVREHVEQALDAESGSVYRDLLERVERPLLEAALLRTDGNQIRAAALLGINRNTLRKKIVELDVRVPGRG